MTRISEREVARKLALREELEPPPDLLARLKAEIPAAEIQMIRLARLDLQPEERPERRGLRDRRLWLLAASLLAMVGTGLFSLRVMERMAQPEAEEAVTFPAAAQEAPAADAGVESQAGAGAAPGADESGQEEEDDTAGLALRPLSRKATDGREDQAHPAGPAPSAQPAAEPPPPPPPAPGVLGGRDAGLVEDAIESPMELDSVRLLEEERQKADLEARRRATGRLAAPLQSAPLRKESADAEGKAGAAAAPAVPKQEAEGALAEEIAVVGELGLPKDMPAAGSSATLEHATRGHSTSEVNPFVDTEEDRVSTFGLDVDTASYLVARRYLEDGRLPAPESVRVEEFVNFFHYGDPAPARGDFALAAEGAPTPFTAGERYRLLRFSVRAREAADGAGSSPVARDARADVVFDPRAVARYRLLGYEDRDPDDRGFRAPADPGEIAAGHAVSVLYEVKLQPAARPSMPLATLRLRYRQPDGGRVQEVVRSLRLRDLDHTWEEAPPALRLAAVVAELAEILRGSYWAREGSLEAVLRQARNLSAEAGGGSESERTSELVDLVSRAARLSAGRSAE